MLTDRKIAKDVEKIIPGVTSEFWQQTKELLPGESEYKNSYPYSLTDKRKFLEELFQ